MRIFKKGVLTWPRDISKVLLLRYSIFNRLCLNIIYGDIEHPHNHRWNFTTFVISGGYKEYIYATDGTRTEHIRNVGYVGHMNHNVYHTVEPLVEGQRAVTIMFKSKPKKVYTKFLIDGKETRDIKYFRSIGMSKDDITDYINNLNEGEK